MDIVARIKSHVKVNETTGCWEWQLSTNRSGYGQMRLRTNTGWTMALVHRVIYAATKGEIPDGVNICHSCDTPRCCAPEHLFAGSQLDNIRDAVQKGRIQHGSRHYQTNLTESQIPLIVEALNAGELFASIADRFNASIAQIQSIACGKTWKHVNHEPITRPRRAKLTLQKASEIKRRKLSGESAKSLADEFGVGKCLVNMIARGICWKDA